MEMLTVHTLGPAESIEMLSARYRVPVCMIMRANGIKTERDFERNRRIQIPRQCYCNRCEDRDSIACKSYTVVPGDTLFGIARRHGVTMSMLMRTNGLKSPDSLHEGDRIDIPLVTGVIYSVREGETLEDIALSRGMSATRIRDINGLTPDEPVFAGMQLVLD